MTLFDPDDVVYLTPDSPNGKENDEIIILGTPECSKPVKLTQPNFLVKFSVYIVSP